ncbi:hypothetical protein AB0F17_28670 [Nonomuraea sp. NPDC026600]|uniref:hypothetical protein n=1 Tax=Nonomuraea sp. NPDC026600 TaxID=3155363 RepID=UPI00340759B6
MPQEHIQDGPTGYQVKAGRTGYQVEHATRTRNGQVRSLTAAVQVLQGRRINRGPKQASTATQLPWQVEAWSMYDLVGELRFAVNWLASAISRCRLVPARRVTGSDEPEIITDGPAAELLADWAGGLAGQAQLLRRATQQLVVAGDTYIVGRTLPGGADDEVGEEEWRAYSTEETSWSGAGWQVNPGDGAIPVGAQDHIFRCWLPHPRRYVEAESSVRSALPVLRELHGLTQRVSAEIDSRLAGAGLLILPQEFQFPAGQSAQSGDARDGEDDFINTLIDYMVTPISDRASASAVVPLVITAPGEHIGQAQLIQFWSELDDRSKELREEALDRFARSADMPPEVIKGLSDSNHWSAWAISEDGVQMHVAPLLGILCLAFTVGWYRPSLAELGVEDADEYLVWMDTSPLELKPDKSEAAKELYDRLEIGGDTLRRETGFGEDDKPTDDELRRMILYRFLEKVTDPALLLQALGVNSSGIPEGLAEQPVPAIPAPRDPGDDQVDQADGAAAPGTPATQDDARDGDGSRTAAAAADEPPAVAIVAAAEVAVRRAMAYAGKRLLTRTQRGQYADVPVDELHMHIPITEQRFELLMYDAWTALEGVVPGRPEVITACDRYVRDLLRHGVKHEPRFLAKTLCDEIGLCP